MLAAVLLAGASHRLALNFEAADLQPPGSLVIVPGGTMHVLASGDPDAPTTVVLMAGAATIAPSYDFAALAADLAKRHRVVIVEKLGYGYSDLTAGPRDVKSLVSEVRGALEAAGEGGPFVLMPHSMSGLEALWWAQEHPSEVTAIVGLDMSTPEAYLEENQLLISATAAVGKGAAWLGVQRIPGLYPGISDDGLSEAARAQQSLLVHRNAANSAQLGEAGMVLNNAQTVGVNTDVSVPLMLVASNGDGLPSGWVGIQERLAERTDAPLVHLECPHAVHRCQPETIAQETSLFLGGLAE